MMFRKSRTKDLLLQATAMIDRGAGLPIAMQLSSQSSKWLEGDDALKLWSRRMLKMQREHSVKTTFAKCESAPIRIFRDETLVPRPSVALQQEVALGEETLHVANA